MTDTKPFNHGEEGTHNVCNKHNIGGKSVCCKCSGKVGCGDEFMEKNNTKVYYIQGGGDEQFTPRYGVEVLLPYIQHLKGKVIWCPFDREDSQFVIVLKENGFNVVYSHIDYGQDFLTYEPESWDVIISNPPYKNKRTFWERALDFGKPFTLLLPLNILSDSVINVTMREREREFQLLIPSRRMRFYNYKTGETGNQPTFKASYFGVNIFEQQIILAEMNLPSSSLTP